jgi:hypothetical protein
MSHGLNGAAMHEMDSRNVSKFRQCMLNAPFQLLALHSNLKDTENADVDHLGYCSN